MARLTVTAYSPNPPGTIAGLGLLLLLGRQANFHSGSLIYDSIFSHLPALWAQNLANYRKLLFWVIVGVHTVQAVWLDTSRLSKHGIPRFSGLWCKWILSIMVEGYPNFARFDQLVREKERAR